MRAAHSCNSLSPMSCPYLSLTGLNSSKSTNITAISALSRRALISACSIRSSSKMRLGNPVRESWCATLCKYCRWVLSSKSCAFNFLAIIEKLRASSPSSSLRLRLSSGTGSPCLKRAKVVAIRCRGIVILRASMSESRINTTPKANDIFRLVIPNSRLSSNTESRLLIKPNTMYFSSDSIAKGTLVREITACLLGACKSGTSLTILECSPEKIRWVIAMSSCIRTRAPLSKPNVFSVLGCKI